MYIHIIHIHILSYVGLHGGQQIKNAIFQNKICFDPVMGLSSSTPERQAGHEDCESEIKENTLQM